MKTLSERFKYLSVALEIFAFIAVITHLVTLAASWSHLPASVPVHFDLAGNADGYGHRSDLVILFILSFLLYAGLSLLSLFPDKYNYPSVTTPENVHRQHELGSRFVQLLKLVCVWLFCLISMYSMGIFSG